MTRSYTQKRRAEQQAMTRRRIVEAAVKLHGSIGPASTTVSMIAEQAGVQRRTFYAHFPQERELFLACSGLVDERDPLPDPKPWQAMKDPQKRLQAGLRALYDWYKRNARLLACILRDGEHHALTKEVTELHLSGPMAAYRQVLSQGLDARQRALLGLALSFFTWRTLTQGGRLTQDAAASAMTLAIISLKSSSRRVRA